jgi:hypothetical protein
LLTAAPAKAENDVLLFESDNGFKIFVDSDSIQHKNGIIGGYFLIDYPRPSADDHQTMSERQGLAFDCQRNLWSALSVEGYDQPHRHGRMTKSVHVAHPSWEKLGDDHVVVALFHSQCETRR